MSEDISIASSLNDNASTVGNYLRTNASATNEAANVSAGFSSDTSSVDYKSDSEILNDLRMDGSASMKTARQVASEYNISLKRAQDILDELQGTEANDIYSAKTYNVSNDMTNDYSYSVDYNSTDEYSTVSYIV